MVAETSDRIEKHVFLRAPRTRVWRALTTPAEFGAWFGVRLQGAFRVGAVEFRLEDAPGGTSLSVIESGFELIPAACRATALTMNDGGWAIQVQNIARHVAS